MTTAAAVQPSISPVLRYADARGIIEWLARAFAFEPQAVDDKPDGTVAHAELRFGTGVVGLSSASHATADNPWSRTPQGVYVSIPDVDRHHDAARAAGATIAMRLQDMDYGSREYSALDLAGHLWGFGTYQMGPALAPTFFVNLHYPDGAAAIAWLERAFGFQAIMTVPGEDDIIHHAELRMGTSVLMLSSAPKDERLWGGRDQCTCVYTTDPDAHHARAVSAGATIVDPPRDTPWGARGYFARDPEDFLWGFSNYRPRYFISMP